ncbi:hypothetical protein AcW1_000275 [Taiwanofungus camphoratus]|nr:hypothetical protein AcW2_010276 [Antrodia cinnamomea]KAI0935877.1 hypothetical protein AcV5_004176 [Antrodia cinnamomea]KAI0961103.1 hypothetical protein AcV7_000296 [Antrodia cinnamomea]KAI0963094.1 hypothetical protein AcW1_000275 [Antrodia cinnamomea]
MATTVSLISLPPELTERILIFAHPRDVSRFTQTCRSAYSLVYGSNDLYLWREMFLSYPFDDLRKALPPFRAHRNAIECDWQNELQRRVDAETVARRGTKGSPRHRALETFVSAVETALPVTESPTTTYSNNLSWLDKILRQSISSFDSALLLDAERQLLSRLRTYLALSHESRSTEESRARLNSIRKLSRCFVYDLRRYSAETLWGPFIRDKKGLHVNWEHLEHVLNVVMLKLQELPPLALRIYGQPRPGLEATRAYSAPLSFQREPHDWAGISGTWRRFVCFMDYRDLFAFNYATSTLGQRDPSFFDDDYQEAIRPVELQLEVLDQSATSPSASTLDRTLNPNFPPLLFKGRSSTGNSNDAVVEGSVRLLADGAVRWSFVTKYDGLTQWSAEGVQLGHVCSAAGVAGIWTGAFHEEADPAGPFWMWKVSAALPEGFQI